MSMGGGEIIILLVIVAVLFGPTILAFWIGYTMGQRKSKPADVVEAPATDDQLHPKEPRES